MKSQSYPESIPASYAGNETLASAYRAGWNHGHGIACHNIPELGSKLFVDDMGRVVVDAENIREVHQSLCFSAESNSRQYSPFEFLAHDLNSLGEDEDEAEETEATSEEAWEAFEFGVSDSIFADLATYTDEDYGIESDEETEEA